MRRAVTGMVLVLTVLGREAALAQAAPRRAPEAPAKTLFSRERFRVPFQKLVLENGLTLLVHEDHATPIVSVNLWYHVGSRNEKRGKTGFAHLFEHFFFNGSENYPHGFREAMDDLGATNRNGTTNGDRTNFFEDVPVSALERTLYLEADRMGFLGGYISKEMLERERGVVQNEKRQGENQPYGSVFARILNANYPYSHPYSWSTIGSMDDLNAASLDDIKEWYRTYYGPNNCVLSLAGDITSERALALVKKYFGGIPPGPPLARTERWIPRLDRNIRERMEDRVAEARIYRTYPAAAWADGDAPYLRLLANALSGSKSALLDRRLVYEKELATAVSASYWDQEIAGAIVLTATVKKGVDPAVVEAEMDDVVTGLLKTGLTAGDVERASSRLLADFVRSRERLGGFGGRADILAESMTYSGDPEAYLTSLETVSRATPADVRKVASRWLEAPHYTLLVSPLPALSPGATAIDRKALPALADAPDIRFPPVQRARLSNGLAIVLLERTGTPLVNLTLAVDAGFASDTSEKAGVASLAVELLEEGTPSRDAFRISDELDLLGARIRASSSLDQSLLTLEALDTHLTPALAVFADVLKNPAFPEDKVSLGRDRLLARIAQEGTQPTSAALRVVPRLLYGAAHAYGNPLTGSGYAATVKTITRDDLVAWHRMWFRPGSSTLVVTGDVKLGTLVPLLEKSLAGWAKGEAPKKRLEVVPATRGRRVFLIDKPGATQSVIMAAHVTEPGGQKDDLAIEVAMRNFGGMATSRLNRNLRLDKHWSYGTSGRVVEARGQRPFLVIAPVQTDKTREAILEVVKEIRGVAGERKVAGEEFTGLLRSSTLRLPGRFETLAAVEAAALQVVNLGYPDDYFEQYAGNVRALTAESLAEASARYVRPDEVVWVIVGDLAKVEAGVRELGLGEVTRLDANGDPL